MSKKEVTFEINSIAIAVAIVIIRHRNTRDSNKYYSAMELVDEVNNLPFSDIIRIHDISMLQQGLFYFKRILGASFPHLLLNMQQSHNEYFTLPFGKLEKHKASYDVKFLSQYPHNEFASQQGSTISPKELQDRITTCSNYLLRDHKSEPRYTLHQIAELAPTKLNEIWLLSISSPSVLQLRKPFSDL